MSFFQYFYKIPLDIEMIDNLTDTEKKIIGYFFTQASLNNTKIVNDTLQSLSFKLNVNYSHLSTILKQLIKKEYLIKKYNNYEINYSVIENDILISKKNKLIEELIKAAKSNNECIPKEILNNIIFLYKNMFDEFESTLVEVEKTIESRIRNDNSEIIYFGISKQNISKFQRLTQQENKKLLDFTNYLIGISKQKIWKNQNTINIENREKENRDNNTIGKQLNSQEINFYEIHKKEYYAKDNFKISLDEDDGLIL